MSLKSTCPFGLIYSHTILPTRAHLPMFPTAVNKTTLNFLSPETLESSTSFFMFTPNIESVQFSSVAQSCPTLYNPMDCNTPGPPFITNSRSLLKFMSIESVMPSNHPILCCPLFLLLSIYPSTRVFSNESVLLIRWPKYWSFSFNSSPSNEHPGLLCSWMDWLDLLAVQGTLKSLLQHHSSKTSILWCSALFIVQLSIHT